MENKKMSADMHVLWPTGDKEVSVFSVPDLARGVGLTLSEFAKACTDSDEFLSDSVRNVDPVRTFEAVSYEAALHNAKLNLPGAAGSTEEMVARIEQGLGRDNFCVTLKVNVQARTLDEAIQAAVDQISSGWVTLDTGSIQAEADQIQSEDMLIATNHDGQSSSPETTREAPRG